MINTDVPPKQKETPAKLIKASGSKHINVKYMLPKTVSLAKTLST